MDLDKLLADREEQEKQKRRNEMWGAIGDTLGNQKSAGHFFLGASRAESTAGRDAAKAENARMVDPYEQAMASLEMKSKTDDYGKKQDELQRAAAKRDANSAGSKAAKYFYQSKGLKVEPDDTEESLTERYGKSSDYSQAEFKAKLDRQKKTGAAGGLTPYQQYQRDRDAKLDEEKASQKEMNLMVPGLGKAFTPDDAKVMKTATELKSDFDFQLDELISLRENKGAEVLDRNAVGRAKQLSKDLLLKYKDLSKLGVLSKADEAILNEIIPADPLQFNVSSMWGKDPTLTKLNGFRSDVNRSYQERIANRIRDPEPGLKKAREESESRTAGKSKAAQDPLLGSANAGQKTVVKRQVNPKTGQTRLVYSDGTIELVEK